MVIRESAFPGNLIQFNVSEFHGIFIMNFLATHVANINYRDLKVTLRDNKDQEVYFYSERDGKKYLVISRMKASKLLRKKCVRYWCYAV